jgi:hypothetical protein
MGHPYGHRWRTVTRPRILARAGALVAEDGWYGGGARCERCHWLESRVLGRASQIEIAHLLIPPGKPGHDADDNLAALCLICHRKHDYAEWARKCYETRAARKDRARPLLLVEANANA